MTAAADDTTFWREVTSIKTVFRRDAVPEPYLPGAMTGDERFSLPLSETVGSRPRSISVTQNRRADVLMPESAALVDRHDHPHQLFGLTLSGRWSYLEQESIR